MANEDQKTVAKPLRTLWPSEALQVMQTVDELRAEMLKCDEQRKDLLLAAETAFVEDMVKFQDRLQRIEKIQKK